MIRILWALIRCLATSVFEGRRERGKGGREGKTEERGDAACGCTSGKSALKQAAAETGEGNKERALCEREQAGKEREEGPGKNQGLALGHRHRHEYIATRRAYLHHPPSTQRRPVVHSLTILNAIFAYYSQNPLKGRKERERGKRKDGKPGKSKEREPMSGSRAVPSS
ncbi:hypothetical protein B0H13DRAFT_2533719 [Mycena leptocephala]|nr:hypothetical protein B0H13DRAFT_2533719 [Mycena leptocephala]